MMLEGTDLPYAISRRGHGVILNAIVVITGCRGYHDCEPAQPGAERYRVRGCDHRRRRHCGGWAVINWLLGLPASLSRHAAQRTVF
jgi:hypothetical protein